MQRCHHFYTYEKMPHRNSNCLYPNASSGPLLRRGRKSQTYVLLSCLLGWVWTTVRVGQWRSCKLAAPAASHNSKLSPIQEELIRRQESLPYTSADPTQHLLHILQKKGCLTQCAGTRAQDNSLCYSLRTLLPEKQLTTEVMVRNTATAWKPRRNIRNIY